MQKQQRAKALKPCKLPAKPCKLPAKPCKLWPKTLQDNEARLLDNGGATGSDPVDTVALIQ